MKYALTDRPHQYKTYNLETTTLQKESFISVLKIVKLSNCQIYCSTTVFNFQLESALVFVDRVTAARRAYISGKISISFSFINCYNIVKMYVHLETQ